MGLLKTITGKVVAGIAGLGVIAGGISWWQMDPSSKDAIWTTIGRCLGWLGLVLILPWATFFLSTWVGRYQRNSAGAALVAGYTMAEAVILAWLFHWSISGVAAWVFFAVGVLLAAVYNLFTCDWIAEKFR